MKKIFSVLTAVLFAGSMMAAEVTVEKTMSEIIAANNYKVSQNQDVTCYKSFNLNDEVSVSTSGDPNCGSFWGTSPNNDWRLYQAKKGDITIAVASGCSLKKVAITYNIKNGGALKTPVGEIDRESGLEYEESGTSVTYKVLNSGTATNGQAQITKIKVVYESANVKVAAPVISPERAYFIGRFVQVSMTCSTEGAQIYYTLNGADPVKDASGTSEYSGPVNIPGTVTVKAIAIKGDDKSAISEKTYTKRDLMTVSEAIAALKQNSSIENAFVKGKVVSVKEGSLDEDNGTMTYFISDDGTAANQLQVYNGYYLEDMPFFVTEMALSQGARVTVFGNLKVYKPKEGDPVNEFDSKSIIIEYNDDPEEEGIFNTAVENKAAKTIVNGQLVIIKNGVRYNALGAQIQ